MEDCENLRVYSTLPIPAHRNRKYRTHPVVCCPKIKAPICQPSQSTTTEAPTEELSDYYGDYDYEIVTEKPIYVTDIPTMAEESCASVTPLLGAGTQCVNLKDCPGFLNQTNKGYLEGDTLVGRRRQGGQDLLRIAVDPD